MDDIIVLDLVFLPSDGEDLALKFHLRVKLHLPSGFPVSKLVKVLLKGTAIFLCNND